MQYNSEKEPIRMGAYGRIVQELADQAVKIDNPAKRKAAEHQLLETMARVSGQKNLSPENENILRHHLYLITRGELGERQD